MSKTKLVLKVIDDVRNLAENLALVLDNVRTLADSLQAVADVMLADDQEKEPVKVPAKKTAAIESKKTEPEELTLKLEQVRAVLADKSRKGHTAEVKELLIKYGANKLSDIDPKNYKALLADAEVL